MAAAGVSGAAGALRRRAAGELAALAGLTALYLVLWPRRPFGLDLGLALLALALVGLTARETRERFWGPPAAPRAARRRHATLHMLVGSAAAAMVFLALGALRAAAAGQGLGALFPPTLPLTLALFVPWAAAQQVLFQFYLLGRLRALMPRARASTLAALNGVLFGLVHGPEWDVTLVTIAGGAVWSWYYVRDRCLAPLALSHAALGTAYFYWIRGRDLGLAWFHAFGL